MNPTIHPVRVVLDTNILVRALANPDCPSGELVEACESRLGIALLSKPLLDEYRRVLVHISTTRGDITIYGMERLLRELRYFGDYLPHVRASFSYPRDRTDEKLITLAIDGRATHIASFDEDLLTLPTARSEAGKRFRQRLRGVVIAMPEEILAAHPTLSPPR